MENYTPEYLNSCFNSDKAAEYGLCRVAELTGCWYTIHLLLKGVECSNGVWRCIIQETGVGTLKVYVPKTCKYKVKDLLERHLPCHILFEVKEMKNPLKYKKQTYIIKE